MMTRLELFFKLTRSRAQTEAENLITACFLTAGISVVEVNAA